MPNFLSKRFGTRPKSKICCLHFGRCGSTLLGNMLASHPNLSWAGELFHEHHERTDRNQSLNPYQLLQEQTAKCEKRCFGFETKFQHLDSNGLAVELSIYLRRLTSLGFNKYILLKRNNYLRQALSVAKGQLSGRWHAQSLTEVQTLEPFFFDVSSVSLGGANRTLLKCFEFLDSTYENSFDTFVDLGLNFIEVNYEHHLEVSPTAGFKRVIDFLELVYSRPTISTRRLDSRSVREMITNFDDVQHCLKGSKYEWMCSSETNA